MTVMTLPGGRDRRLRQEASDMIAFRLAHIVSRRRCIDDHTLGAEGLDQRLDRCLATEVHHRAGPIENDQVEAVFECHVTTPVSKRLLTSSSPIAKPVDAPAPQVTIARR